MDKLLEDVALATIQASVKFSNAWFVEYVRQNYIVIIIFSILLFFIWLIGLMIKNWLWKIDKISESLEKISVSLDFLATRADEQDEKDEKIVFTEKEIVENDADPK